MANSAVVGLLRAILVADTAQYDTAMARVSKQSDQFVKDFTKAGTQMSAVGKSLTSTITLPLVGVGAAVSKLAIDFETSFAGVGKTVDGVMDNAGRLTDAGRQMAASFRELSREIPINVNELNKIGEAAGALGIAKADIVDFTKTIALIGVTTNLTSQEAADAVARIQNIFGAAGKDTDRLASTLVALGNAGASTEKEIVEMGQRIAGAGHTIGLTQAQVLAFASTLASVGINAEAGGSSISRIFLKMNNAVMDGGKQLKEFARVANMSAQQFKDTFEKDAGEATVAFIKGLGRLKESGENINSTIEGLTGKNIILKDTLFRLAGAGELLNTQLSLGNKAWQDNTALTIEAGKRFATTESQITLFWNRLKDVGITLGEAFKPAIKGAIDLLHGLLPIVQSLVGFFTSLPTGLQVAAIAFAGLVAAIGPVVWITGQLITAATTVTGAFGRQGVASKSLAWLLRDQALATDQLTAAQIRNAGAAGAGAAGGAAAKAGRTATSMGALATGGLVVGTGLAALTIFAADQGQQIEKLREISTKERTIEEIEKEIIETKKKRDAARIRTEFLPAARLDEQLKALQEAKRKAEYAKVPYAGDSSVQEPGLPTAGMFGPTFTEKKAPAPRTRATFDDEDDDEKKGKKKPKPIEVSPFSVKATTDAIKKYTDELELANTQGGIAAEKIPEIVRQLAEWERQGYKLDPMLQRLLYTNRDLNTLFPRVTDRIYELAKGSSTLTEQIKGSGSALSAMATSAKVITSGTDWSALLKNAMSTDTLMSVVDTQTVGVRLGDGIKASLSHMDQIIMQAVTGGGNVGRSIGQLFGQQISQSLMGKIDLKGIFQGGTGKQWQGLFGNKAGGMLAGMSSAIGSAGLAALMNTGGGQGMLSNVGSFAATGMMFGPWGAAIGAGIGAIVGAFKSGSNQTLKARQEFAKSLKFDNLNALLDELKAAGDAGKKLAEQAQRGIGKGDKKANEQWMKDVTAFFEKQAKTIQQVTDKIGQAQAALQAFGGSAPKSMRPLIEQLLKSTQLTAEQRQMLEGMAKGPMWQTAQDLAQKFGVSNSALGQGFNQDRLAASAFELTRALEVFEGFEGANQDEILRGMADEMSIVADEAQKNNVALPTAIRRFIERVDAMGLLLDENGNRIDSSLLRYADIQDEHEKQVISLLEQIRDLLAGTPPTTPGSETRTAPPSEGEGRTPGDRLELGPRDALRDDVWWSKPLPDEKTQQMPGFETGTKGNLVNFGSGTPVMLHGWEGVYTAADVSRNSPTPMTSTFIFNFDERTLARASVPHLPGETKRLGLNRV